MAEVTAADHRVPRLIAGLGVVLLFVLILHAYAPRQQTHPLTMTTVKTIDINTVDRGELLQVPGLGPSMADAILARRAAVGRFDSLDELDELPGIGTKTLDRLRPWLAVGPGPQPPREPDKLERKLARPGSVAVNVNTAGAEELQSLPGIGVKLAERMLAERAKSPFRNLEDLRRVAGIGTKTLEKLRPHIRFD